MRTITTILIACVIIYFIAIGAIKINTKVIISSTTSIVKTFIENTVPQAKKQIEETKKDTESNK